MDGNIMSLPKPKIGEPCNGCGICCERQLCNTGAFLLRKTKMFGEKTITGRCPALVTRFDGSYACGFILSPTRFIKSKYRPEVISRHVAVLIGAGSGCDEIGDDEGNEIEEKKLDDMIEATKADPEWRKNAQVSFEMIQKF